MAEDYYCGNFIGCDTLRYWGVEDPIKDSSF